MRDHWNNVRHASNFDMSSERIAERLLKLTEQPKCDVCGDTRHSTSLHLLSIETDVLIEEVKKIK